MIRPRGKLLGEKNLRTVLLATILVALTAIASTNLTVAYAQATSVTYVVALDGSGNFRDIQSAINAVPLNTQGIVIAKAGIYDLNPQYKYPYQSISLKSSIILRGAGVDQTVIRCFPSKQPAGSHIRIAAIKATGAIQNVIIENMTVIQNGTPDNLGSSAIELRQSVSNVTIRNVKIRDATGAGVVIPTFNDVTLDNVDIQTAWTGIVLGAGTKCTIKNGRVVNTTGDGIFPRESRVTNLLISDNYLENNGDCSLDLTSPSGLPPHEQIIIKGNVIRNSHIRVTNSKHVLIKGNIIEGNSWSYVDVDSGQARPANVTIEGNRFTTSSQAAIWFRGVQECKALNNMIQMTTTNVTQSGIHAAILGVGLIEGNTIIGAKDYGISFGKWGIGSKQKLTIRNNAILDFGSIGIWDDGKAQGPVIIENNTIWDRHTPFVSKYGIKTDWPYNNWTIRYNHVFAGSVAPISSPKSMIYENIYAEPALFSDGFEAGNFNAWTGIVTSSGETASINNNVRQEGSYSALFKSNGGGGFENAYLYRSLATPQDELSARGYIYVSQSGIAANEDRCYFIVFRNGGTGLAFAGWRMINGVVRWNLLIRNGQGWVSAYSASSPALSRWYSVELHWTRDSVNGSGELYVDGQLVSTLPNKNTAVFGGVNRLQFGLAEAVNCASIMLYGDAFQS
jgi:hypothetical protein